MRKKQVFVAGTFDGMHAGHRAVLTRAFDEGEKVTVGLTSDAFINQFKISNFKFQIRGYEERNKTLELWLQERGLIHRATIIPIDDPYEPAASMKDLDAIVASSETAFRAKEINTLRNARNLKELVIIEIPVIAARDGKPISSTRMRNGEIDHNGRLVMPESMRAELGKPMGKVIKNGMPGQARHDKIIITVGDIATKTFLDAGITPTLSIIDGKVGRKPFGKTLKMLQLQKVKPFRFKAVKSGPGFISRKAIQAIQAMLETQGKQHHAIIIDGEEDLLVLPAIIYAPLGSVVYYGQPNDGLVEVVVTKAKKKEALALLTKFT